MNFCRAILTFACYLIIHNLIGQTYLINNQIPVFVNGERLISAWAGGVHTPQVANLDLDNDGNNDLILFDRVDNSFTPLLPYGNTAPNYWVYAPQYSRAFPSSIQNWIRSGDIDLDGDLDLFTGTPVGSNVAVYKNTSAAGQPVSFTLKTPALISDYPPLLNLYSAGTDLPDVVDIDGDSDLDFLTFSVGGGFIEWHRNMGMEQFGQPDSLRFMVQSSCFGHFQENAAGCIPMINLAPCGPGERHSLPLEGQRNALHAGSTILATNLNADSLVDLIIGDAGCNGVYTLINTGTRQVAHFGQWWTEYPNQLTPIFVEFAALFEIDYDRSGTVDLLATSNAPGALKYSDLYCYFNTAGPASIPYYSVMGGQLFESQMLDMGDGCFPAVADITGDGLPDLLLGSIGRLEAGLQFRCNLSLFQNTGSASAPAFNRIAYNYLNDQLTSSGSVPNTLSPAFGDVDGDGDTDLLMGTALGRIRYFENTALTGQAAQFVQRTSFFMGIDVGTNSAPLLYDLDGDGDQDLLVGNARGRIHYYRNVSVGPNPTYSLVTERLGQIKINDISGDSLTNGFARPAIMDIDQNGIPELLVGGATGMVEVFDLDTAQLTSVFSARGPFQNHDFGSFAAPAALTYGGATHLIVGNNKGGVYLMSPQSLVSAEAPTESLPSLSVYPSPFTDYISIQNPASTPIKDISILNAVGQTVAMIPLSGSQPRLEVGTLPAGIYIVRITTAKGVKCIKVVKE